IIDIDNPEDYIYLSQRGEGPREIINPSRIFLSNEGFCVFDGGKSTLFNFNMQEIQDEKYLPESIFTTTISAIVTWEQLTDSIYITTGIFPENRFYFIDNNGQLIARNGSYPFEFNGEYPFHVKGMASLSAMVKSLKENKIATSTLYGGHIGIYELDVQELTCRTISETNLFSPQFSTQDYEGTPNFSPTPDTRWGYLSIAADENYIYALYSGKLQRRDEEFDTGSIIHVFDWEGKPAYEIKLDKPAYCLDVYQDKLYTLYTDNGPFDIAVYVLP
ncbi:MAG: TolB-like 6-bladed beta-propeller domain-containing protein, partial [Tannerellaceae bacterium]|nr:TolB-like 6-bladed beta-propeller domain-containing protein [Tannerellaceae bacterium]